MKYIVICGISLIICMAFTWIPVIRIGKVKKLKRSLIIILGSFFSLILICALIFLYLNIYYHADETTEVASQTVKVEKIDGGYFFDGPGTDSALIFYPGAKVECNAYAPLMTLLAEQGVDCFLADMPFRIAFFNSKIADRFLNNYSYDNWAAAGHSLGGTVISGYASEHADKISSLILLAAYPHGEIPDSMRFCSIYGTRDGCLNMQEYEKAKIYWPVSYSEHILDGANHAQYANYGPQSGDMDAEITSKEQQELTAEIMMGVIKENIMFDYKASLTDRYINGIPADSRIAKDGRFLHESDVNEKRMGQILSLNDMAKERGQSLAQFALSWILKDSDITSVLIGASRPSQIIDCVKCIDNTKFTSDELNKINDITKEKKIILRAVLLK